MFITISKIIFCIALPWIIYRFIMFSKGLGKTEYKSSQECIENKDKAELKWETIKHLYPVNPDRWKIDTIYYEGFEHEVLKTYVANNNCRYAPYNCVYINFNYADWKKFKIAYKNHLKKKEDDKIKENTISVLEACQKDIEKEKEKAESLKETAVNNFNNITNGTNIVSGGGSGRIGGDGGGAGGTTKVISSNGQIFEVPEGTIMFENF